MRKVIYSEYVDKVEGLNPVATNWQLEEMGEALFHQFGIDHQDCEFGVGNFTTAIIELEDGTVKNIPAEQIRFISGPI